MPSKLISVAVDDGSFDAYASIPDRAGSVAIVVLQEIFGVNANIRAIVDAYADAGYAAVAPDLFWREQPGVQLDPASEDGRARAMELMKSLDQGRAVADAGAALVQLRTLVPGIERTCAIGFCLGGAIAFLMGARRVTDASVSYYGTGIHTQLAELNPPNGRMLLHIAGDDYLCPPDAQAAIQAAAANDADHVEVVVHPGVSHAFARAGGQSFDAPAADRANGLTAELLRRLSAAT